jgi:hypothetical protein
MAQAKQRMWGGLNPGRAVQVDPIRPTLKPPRSKRLKLALDKLLSNFAFKINLRHYTQGPVIGSVTTKANRKPRRVGRALPLVCLKLSVGVKCHPYLFEIEGQFTQGWRPGRTLGESVGGISKWTVLIGRTGFNTIASLPDPTLNSMQPVYTQRPKAQGESMVRPYSCGSFSASLISVHVSG